MQQSQFPLNGMFVEVLPESSRKCVNVDVASPPFPAWRPQWVGKAAGTQPGEGMLTLP